MSTIGIDIGSGSVRLCYNNPFDNVFTSGALNITTIKNRNFISQSSYEIYGKIVSLLNELPKDFKSISVTATCSMVVLEKIKMGNGVFLRPFSCDFDQEKNNNDIILWMDQRPIIQSLELNKSLSQEVLDTLGGTIIPEMGLPKLKWLSDTFPGKQLVAWELHDWITYLLLIGGFNTDFLVPYKKNNSDFHNNSQALDGSIKGWSKEFLEKQSIFVEVGLSEFQLESIGRLYPLGTPFGKLHPSIVQNDSIVCNGCIDCYAGWLSTITNGKKFNDGILSMIAGTSTCFLLSTTQDVKPIPGIWGPFSQLLNGNTKLFEFGQPASGKLFENLFGQYEELLKTMSVIENIEDLGPIFAFLESRTVQLELQYQKPITEIIKHYFYYGDVFGNRSPYNDHKMSEMVIDGVNSSPHLSSIIHSHDIISLTIKYNLILEFLCFQTKQILALLEKNGAPHLHSIIVSGSQANNTRFLSMLADFLSIDVVKMTAIDTKYNVVKGSSIISLIGYNQHYFNMSYDDAFNKAITANNCNADRPHSSRSVIVHHSLIPNAYLVKKYDIYLDMCESQIRYRSLIN